MAKKSEPAASIERRAQNIEMRDVSALTPDPRNARKHAATQVQQIANSITEFGFNAPLLIADDGTVIAGHGRLDAAKKIGLVAVPCIVLDHLTTAQRRAYIIADNKLALNATWDDEMLVEELRALGEDYDPILLGFNDAELGKLFAEDDGDGFDPAAEWTGLPEFENDSARAFRSLMLHFESAEDVADFQKRIEQDFSTKAKFIWHPAKGRDRLVDLSYEDTSSAE